MVHLTCFFRPCSDEDMQSLASLMSMKQADIGNLDDFEEENEEDEENRVNQEEKAAKITGEMHLIYVIKAKPFAGQSLCTHRTTKDLLYC